MQTTTFTAAEIKNWLIDSVASIINIQPKDVDTNFPFERYGLESADIVGLTADLEDWLQCSLEDPTLMYEYSTIEELTTYLHQNHVV